MTLPFEEHCELSPEDRRLLDSIVEAGFDLSALGRLSAEERQRAETIVRLFGMLEDYPVEDSDDSLVHATMACVNQHAEHQAARMKIDVPAESSERSRGWRIRVPDFITVAAVLLIGCSVVWPIMSSMRERSVDAACANNMRVLAHAFSQYAGDYRGAMPVEVAGVSWDNFHNLVNLEPLKDLGFCDLGHLDCPGNHQHSRPSYSYQLQTSTAQAMWGVGPVMAVLGDRNPIIDAARERKVLAPLSISANHGERGQNVLFTDGSARWLAQPTVGDDNIWLPRGEMQLRRGAMPSGPDDAFLTH